MKKTIFLLLTAFIILSCEKKDDPTPTPTPSSEYDTLKTTVLTGELTKNLYVPEGNYTFRGPVIVKSGITLKISAGCTFTVNTADKDRVNVLFVLQGAKIDAQGTATKPIVFTAETKSSGSWGGIVMMGKAKINVAGGTATSESGEYPYGGTDDADNSGVLSYVRLEYAGAKISNGTSEYNAFTFFSIGSGTKLEYLEAYKGADDGFEFFGGAVRANYLLAIDCEDDCFDWDQGFTGGGMNWIAQQDNTADFGIEASNHNTEYTRTPVSKPIITGITILRKAAKANVPATGINFKEGTGASLTNLRIIGVDTAILIGDSTTARLAVNDPSRLKITNLNVSYIANKPNPKRIAYKQNPSAIIPTTNIPDTDGSTSGADDAWTSASWVVGYTKP